MSMFCYQCEQTAKGTGCTIHGVCGKSPQVAALQDLLIHCVKGISMYAHRARQLGATDDEVNLLTAEALFTTVTNVNFDPEALSALIKRAGQVRDKAKALYEKACAEKSAEVEELSGPAVCQAAGSIDGMVDQAVGVERHQ